MNTVIDLIEKKKSPQLNVVFILIRALVCILFPLLEPSYLEVCDFQGFLL